MSKGLLITYAGYPYTPSSLFPDNGLANIAGRLQDAGHECRVWDLNTISTMRLLMTEQLRSELLGLLPRYTSIGSDPDITKAALELDKRLEAHWEEAGDRLGDFVLEELRTGRYDWAGFKLYMGDGLRNSIRIAERIRREEPHIRLFAGGPQVDLVEGALFRRTSAFDAIVSGEGEESIVPLAEYVDGSRPLDQVPNALWLDSGTLRKSPTRRVENLDDLPLPRYDTETYPSMAGDEKIKIVTYDESRGCPNRCAFCIHAEKSGTTRRVKTPERMARELAQLRRQCDTRLFRLAGSSTPYPALVDLSRKLVEDETDILFSAYGTVHGLEPDMLPILVEGGLWGLFFGVESGSERILREGMEKRRNHVAGMVDTLTSCLDAGLFVVASILYPAPGEDEESTQATLELLRKIFGGRAPSQYSIPVSFAGLFPRTPWFRQRERFGFSVGDEDAYMEEVMDYRIKAIMPYALWPEASYSLDGKPQRELAMEAARLLGLLRQEGFTTMLLDDTALVATLAEIPIPRALEQLGAMFFGGQTDAVADLARRINRRAAPGGGLLPGRGSASLVGG